MTKDEALKLALKALEADELDMVDDGSGNMVFRKEQAITAIKEALAQPEQEPVAWEQFHEHMAGPFYKAPPQPEQEPLTENGMYRLGYHNGYGFGEAYGKANSPQRTWVGLTAKEKHEIRYSHMTSAEFIEFIEAKLKDKNLREQK